MFNCECWLKTILSMDKKILCVDPHSTSVLKSCNNRCCEIFPMFFAGPISKTVSGFSKRSMFLPDQ